MQQNPSYSLRAFARDLQVSHCYLSQVINGKRRLSLARANLFCEHLKLSGEGKKDFLNEVFESNLSKKKIPGGNAEDFHQNKLIVEIERFRLVNEWYHGAISELTELTDFVPKVAWIAARLSITPKQARDAIKRLFRLGLLSKVSNTWQKANRHVYFPTEQPHFATKNYHRQMITKGLRSLDHSSPSAFAARDITSVTVATNPKRIARAKKQISTFRKRLMTDLAKGEQTEVYQINIQLFPLSRSDG